MSYSKKLLSNYCRRFSRSNVWHVNHDSHQTRSQIRYPYDGLANWHFSPLQGFHNSYSIILISLRELIIIVKMGDYSIRWKNLPVKTRKKIVAVWPKSRNFLNDTINAVKLWRESSLNPFNLKEEIITHHLPFSCNCKELRRR